ncbi:hypothetical protein AG0111_0g12197 [Alternaria gaisen]|uniref:Uncharacterized protein n=1 Tax=Alternaria gaisen TaxID=167740 RepID=A0ACB6F576_9PLEO|nr:hypothetical protein AG0111_0g12197 [Alternaria gaisen]
MEAIAGLSLAANILQVVDFTMKVLSTANEFRKAGSTVQNHELELVVNDLTALNERTKSWARPNPASSGPLAKDSQALENLAIECQNITQELLVKLESLRCSKEATIHKTILSALRVIWNAKTIQDIQSRLQTMRDELQFRILVSIRDDQLQGLDEDSRKAIQSILESNKELSMKMTSQTERILDRQNFDSALASLRHNEVLHAITNRTLQQYSIQDVTREIKDRLHFTRKDDRYDDITAAHQNTFNWALEGCTKGISSWSSLPDWLRADGGVYWISGKAGSGKSTLMKYLYQDPRFMEALRFWAGEDRLIVADFYFWNPGAEIQKSLEGLFRSLLWQVLDQNASLASTLFAEQYLPRAEWNEFPTFHQLRRAFGRLTIPSRNSTKIAIIIDGLDEFDAQGTTMTDLGEMLITATKSGSVKALLSSRPLPAFVDCFASQPQLELQQLTHDDITAYVNDNLVQHPQMVHLTADHNNKAKTLVEEIVSSASGVFLWVKLVVRSLLGGLQNGDKIEDLQSRLRDLPRDLEALFTHMLSTVPARYKPQAACIFQILRCNDEGIGHPHPFSQVEARPLSAIRLSYAEAKIDDVLGADISPLSEDQMGGKESEMERRLRSRCAGLLELRIRAKSQEQQTSQTRQRDHKDVVYLHRTVAEFLHEPKIWNELVSHADELEFHASVAMLQSLVAEVKLFNLGLQPQANRKVPWGLIIDAMLFARLTEAQTQTSCRKLLDELDRAVTTYVPTATGRWKGGRYEEATWCDTFEEDYNRAAPWHDNFMSLNVRFGMTLYVRDTILAKGSRCLVKPGRPLLDYACRPEPRYGHWSSFSDPDLVQTLLLNGAKPNDKFNGFSAWQNCLYTQNEDIFKWLSILKLLVLYGADVNAYIERRHYKRRSDLVDIEKTTALAIVQKFSEGLEAEGPVKEKKPLRMYGPSWPMTRQSSTEIKSSIDELEALLIKRGAKKVYKEGSSRLYGERVMRFMTGLLRRDHK